MAKPKLKPISTNKIFDLLQQFEPATMRQFSKFVASPFFNESKTLSALFFELEKLVKAEKTAFDKEAIWAKIFSDRPYDDVLFRRINANLMALVDRFLAEKALESKPILTLLLTCEQYGNEHILMNEAHFLKAKNDIDQSNKQQSSTEFLDFFHLHKLNYRSLKFDNERLIQFPFHEITKDLDHYYFVEKLRFFCINTTTSRKSEQINFITPIIENIRERFEHYPLIVQQYYFAAQSILNIDNEVIFVDFKNSLILNPAAIVENEASELFEFAMNNCILNTNKGKTSYYSYYFEVVSVGLEYKILIHNHEMVPWHFNNIVVIALRIDKVEWAENFIENYKQYLAFDARDNIVNFSLSRIYWYKKDYAKLMELLKDVEFEDIGYSLITKSTLMKAYYELDEIEALSSFLDSFRVYINRHKEISAQRRKNYLYLIKFVKKLSKTIPGDTKSISKLREELTATKDVLSSDWLYEKIDELQPKTKK